MEGWLDASYFHPPAVGVDAAPYWVLLNKKVRVVDCDNATTAYATTSAGRTIKVTFCLADPPDISHVYVHYTESKPDGLAYSVKAEVSSSAKDLVLLRCSTRGEPHNNTDDYFIYHAAAGKPSLRAIPRLPIIQEYPRTSFRITPPCITLLPFDDDNDDAGEFLLAYLTAAVHPVAYDLRIFSSKMWAWSTRALTPPAGVRSDDMPCVFDKVIALGGSSLGWADLNFGGGIIAYDVLDQDPANTRFIPLPKSDFYKHPDRSCSPQPVHRDVACYSDGFIVLVDLDLRFRYVALDSNDEKKPVIKTIRDLDHVNAILDSELICEKYSVHVVHVPDGWKIRTCYRHVSWDYWRTGHVVDVDDIVVYDPRHRTMLSELFDGGAGRWTLRKLKAKRPTLGMQGGDLVYFTVVSKKGHNGRHSKKEKQKLTIGIDLAKKTVEMLEPYRDGEAQTHTFSQHVNTPRPQQNMWNIDGSYYNESFQGYADDEHAGYGYDNYQHPLLWSPSVPQHHGPSFNSLGSGCVYPVNAQFMAYPVPMANTVTHGQEYLSQPLLPLGPAPPLLASFVLPWRQA